MPISFPGKYFPWLGAILALSVFGFAAISGAKFYLSGAVNPGFNQRYFEPAVMVACGYGFTSPKDVTAIPGLWQFLTLESPSFSCDAIPPAFERGQLLSFQMAHRYLIGSVGLTWRATEISWGGLAPLYGLLFGLSAVAVYGIFRFGMGSLYAGVLAVIFATSPLQLTALPHLRDYAKAPFILLLMFMLGLLVCHKLRPLHMVLLCFLAGAVLGLGLGFRMDLLILVPLVLATIFFFVPGGIREHLRSKGFSALGFLGAAALMGWPLLDVLARGGNTFHVILLGLMTPFDPALQVTPSEVYELGYRYDDGYVGQLVNDYASRILGASKYETSTIGYDRAGFLYYLEYLKTFPADVVTRFLSAVYVVLQTTDLEFRPFLRLLAPWIGSLAVMSSVATVVFLSFKDLRIALFVFLCTLYLCGYPSLQFQGRHSFYLQFMPLFFLGFISYFPIRAATGIIRSKRAKSNPISSIENFAAAGTPARSFLLMAIVVLLCGGFYGGLIHLQERGLKTYIGQYESLAVRQKPFSVENIEDDVVRIVPADIEDPGLTPNFPMRTGYWSLELGGPFCEADRISLRLKYEASPAYLDASRMISLDVRNPVRYLFHTFSSHNDRRAGDSGKFDFKGLELSAEDLPCVKAFNSIPDLESLPFLLNLTLSPDWQERRLFQRIGRSGPILGPHAIGNSPYFSPESLKLERQEVQSLLEKVPVSGTSFEVFDKNVRLEDGRILYSGIVPAPFTYVTAMPMATVGENEYLVAEGDIRSGGITIGLLRNGAWAYQSNVTVLGKFRTVIGPDAGEYVVVVAHNVPGQKTNDFSIDRIGWVRKE